MEATLTTGGGTAKTVGDHKILGVIRVPGGALLIFFPPKNFFFFMVNISIWVVYPWPVNIPDHGQF